MCVQLVNVSTNIKRVQIGCKYSQFSEEDGSPHHAAFGSCLPTKEAQHQGRVRVGEVNPIQT